MCNADLATRPRAYPSRQGDAPTRAIQELAGHADLTMTQRYRHVSPAALDAAIRLLDEPRNEGGVGVSARQI
jgi:integrase